MTVRKLLWDARLTIPAVLATLLMWTPVTLVILANFGRLDTVPSSTLWNIGWPMKYLPVLVYYMSVHYISGNKVAAWWRLPATPSEIGRAIWWQTIGFPLLVIAVAELVNLFVANRFHKYNFYYDPVAYKDALSDKYLIEWRSYANRILEQSISLSIIVVNWGAWSFFRFGRLRNLHDIPPSKNGAPVSAFMWVSLINICLTMYFIEDGGIGLRPDAWMPTERQIFSCLLPALVAAALYVNPNYAYKFNALREEYAFSRTSNIIAVFPIAMFVLLIVFYIVSSVIANVNGDLHVTSIVQSVVKTIVGGILIIALLFYVNSIIKILYVAVSEGSLVGALPDFTKFLPSVMRRGWFGIANFDALLFTLLIVIPLIIISAAFAGPWSLGLWVCGAAIACVATAVQTNARALAGLPVTSARMSRGLHITAALVTSLPFAIALPFWLAKEPGKDELTAMVDFWLLTIAFSQLWIPFRLGGRNVAWPLRVLVLFILTIWAVLAMRSLWADPFSLIGMGGAITQSVSPYFAGFILLTSVGLGFWQTYLSLGPGLGGRHSRSFAKA